MRRTLHKYTPRVLYPFIIKYLHNIQYIYIFLIPEYFKFWAHESLQKQCVIILNADLPSTGAEFAARLPQIYDDVF